MTQQRADETHAKATADAEEKRMTIEDGWTIGVCAWKENVESYKAESEDK